MLAVDNSAQYSFGRDMTSSREGNITVEDDYKVWFRQVGSEGIPLLVLHGGPGAGHDYLESLGDLSTDRGVIFYDQLGCGRSDKPDDAGRWQISRFVREVDMVRDALGLDTIHLLGQSWGGWLAIEYMLNNPSGVLSLTLASTSASARQFLEEVTNLKMSLPQKLRDSISYYESIGDFTHPDYQKAVGVFYDRHFCRLETWPESLERTGRNLEGNSVYETMWGKNELACTGNLEHWDRSGDLGEINVPTLITVGLHDEMTPNCAETLRKGIPNSTVVVYEHSAHMAHLEEKHEYLNTVAQFLRSNDPPDNQIENFS